MIAIVIDFFLKLIQHNKHLMIGWESKASALLLMDNGEQIFYLFVCDNDTDQTFWSILTEFRTQVSRTQNLGGVR